MCRDKNVIDQIRRNLRALRNEHSVPVIAELYEDTDHIYDLTGVFLVVNGMCHFLEVDKGGWNGSYKPPIPYTEPMGAKRIIREFDADHDLSRVLFWR